MTPSRTIGVRKFLDISASIDEMNVVWVSTGEGTSGRTFVLKFLASFFDNASIQHQL